MSDTQTIAVLLVDDQPLVRAGLKMILGPEDGFLVLGECAGYLAHHFSRGVAENLAQRTNSRRSN